MCIENSHFVHRYCPGLMMPSTTYDWRVDESAGTQTHKGPVWSYTTDDFLLVDDFEDYSSSAGSEPFIVWLDGFLTVAADGNGSGGIIATNPPNGQVLLETADRHGGAQAVPFIYNNTGVSAFDGLPRLTYSQIKRSWFVPQDWTVRGQPQGPVQLDVGDSWMPFSGLLDGVRIDSRAMTPEEIADLATVTE